MNRLSDRKNQRPPLKSKIALIFQPTVLAMVPPLVSFLATHPMVKSSHLSSVKVMTGGAAPFGPALIDKFLEKCKPNVVKFREGKTHFEMELIGPKNIYAILYI